MTNFDEKWGIPEEQLTTIIEIIKKRIRFNQLLLFGSRAKGNFRVGSDIDIAILGDNLSLEELTKVRVDFSELSLPYNIDLVDYNSITNKELIEHINRIGVVLEWK